MLFNSPAFLFAFLPLTVAAYLLLRRLAGPRAVLCLLLAASVFFYGWWNPIYLPLLGGITVANFTIAQAILGQRRRGRSQRVTWLLTLGIALNLLLLGYFKYADFMIGTANSLFGADAALLHIILPLGISFITFQKIAYLIDASRGEVEQHDFLEYAFFVMFFPQLIAGPIVHHREIFSQIKGPWAFAIRPSNFMVGLAIFSIGLFKKVVLADNIAPYATGVFEAAAAGQPIDFFLAWQGAIAFKFQLYYDFCGYSEMALGAARLFGIQLPLNFNSPYLALNIVDFWRRWHMTLSRFLRNYVYIPLGGNRKGRARYYLNLLLTMTISGLWHGAAWHFVLWGTSQGVGMVANDAWRRVWRPVNTWWSRSIARLLTFFTFAAVLVMYRAPSLDVAMRIYRGMVNFPRPFADAHVMLAAALGRLGVRFDSAPISDEQVTLVWWLVALMAAMWFLPNTQQLLARWHPAFNFGITERLRDLPLIARVPSLARFAPLMQLRLNAASAVLVGTIAAIACLSLHRISEFLYFEF